MRRIALFLALAVPAPAAAQATFQQLLDIDARVAAIGYRLAVAGAAAGLCEDRVALPGFTVHGLSQYTVEGRRAAATLFPLGARFSVLAVAPGSPAARAGIVAGAPVFSIDGEPVTAMESPDPSYEATASFETQLETGLADGSIAVGTAESDTLRTVTIAAEQGCRTRFGVDSNGRLNASADGTYVRVTTAMVEFASDDDSLALVLAHELAHNILRHRERLDADGVARGLFRAFGRNPGRIRATEDEADRLALYLMARAGFDHRIAPAFWDRFVRRTGAGILSDRTHSSRSERMAAASREVAIIDAQIVAGRPPMPDPPILPQQQPASQSEIRR